MKWIWNVVSYLTTYLIVFLCFSVVYFGLFRSPLFASQHVLFYRGMMYLIVTCFGAFLAMIFIAVRFHPRHIESLVSAIILSASIHMVLFVVFPVTFERSVTTYLLSTLNDHSIASCGGLSKSDLQDHFINSYVIAHDAIGKRMNEQQIIQTIAGDAQCYQITNSGKALLDMNRICKLLYQY